MPLTAYSITVAVLMKKARFSSDNRSIGWAREMDRFPVGSFYQRERIFPCRAGGSNNNNASTRKAAPELASRARGAGVIRKIL